MKGKKVGTTSTADREISITRILDAPRDLVWRVWTEPKHTALWWGPKGFTNTIRSMDVQAGRRLGFHHAWPRRRRLSE